EPARTRLTRGVLALAVSLGVGGGLVAWALWHAPARPVTRRHWVGSVALTALAAAALLLLTPLGSRFAWENAHPLDPRFAFILCTGCQPQVAGLDGRGPVAPVDAPWVVLSPSGFRVDGVPARTREELHAILKSKRELWRQLNPRRDFPGAVMLNARAVPTVGELEAAFRTVLRAGYPKAYLAFSEVLRQTRPVLGGIVGERSSALRIFLAQWRADCPILSRQVLHLGAASDRSLAAWVNELGGQTQGGLCAVLPSTNCAMGLGACRGSQEPGFKIVREWSLGERVEAVQLGRGQEEYQLALVGRDTAIEVELMNDPRDLWDGFAALEVRTRNAGRRLLWAMNAGMYHPDRSPVGLLVSGSHERAPLNTRSGRGNFFLMPNGVFEVTDFGIGVQTTGAWQNDIFTEPREATQSGPMLVMDGQVHPAFERDSPSRLIRNGIGVAGEIVVMAISTTRVNFHEFATSMRDLGCADALYLDGNVSSVFAPGLQRRDAGLGLGPVLVVSEPAN
ncbi:MAG TPA: phosphodiester glycosidase family protein, partial [Polyangiaceae bacterium]|nr:phosphodiester glycosidase family protein [Polyangiaceae bacterium]